MCLEYRRLLPAAAAAFVCLIPSTAGAQLPPGPVPPPVVRDVALGIDCAPQAAFAAPAAAIRIVGGQERGKRLFGTNEAVVLNAGTSQGLKAGQEYYVRRVVADRFTVLVAGGLQPLSIHTAGVVRVVDTHTDAAIGVVTRACDGLLEGDYLEPFTPPPAPPLTTLTGDADFLNPGHLILADDRRQLGGAGAMMVLDRGSDHGLRSGQRLTIFREIGSGPIFKVADAVAISVSPETSLVRIDASKDAVYVGDLVAIHR